MLAIYLDMGTTNTRVWLVDGSRILARAARPVGVRDTARDRSKARIHTALVELIDGVGAQASAASGSDKPRCVIAAGMSSSLLGLVEIPHARAPAGIRELAALSQWIELPEVTDLPVFLIPGVRSGSTRHDLDSIGDTDIMRGEETLCVGLISLGLVEPPAVVLNLGSHWKAIQIDAAGRVATSITTLSGELIHSAQTQTVLASSVINEQPVKLDQHWMEAGMKEQRRSGLSRALFCVRLLELAPKGTAEDRLSFLIGAFIAADLDLLIARGMLSYNTRSIIAGNPALAEGWRSTLAGVSISAVALTPSDIDKALLAGLRAILLESNRQVGNGPVD